MARSGSAATYIWNATPYVAKLVADQHFGDRGIQDLEETALQVLVAKAPLSHAQTMSVKIVYERNGSVSPVYGTPTFAGIEAVATLSAKRADLLRNSNVWQQSLSKGAVPSGLTIAVTGKLPPPN